MARVYHTGGSLTYVKHGGGGRGLIQITYFAEIRQIVHSNPGVDKSRTLPLIA